MSRRNTISREFFATIAAVLVLGLSVMCAIQTALSAAYFIGERKSSLTDVLNGATALSERFADEGSIVTKPLQGEDVLERAHSGFELFNTASGALVFIADENGQILLHTGDDAFTGAGVPASYIDELNEGNDIFETGTLDGVYCAKYYTAGRRITVGGQDGYLFAASPMAALGSYMTDMLTMFGISAAVILILCSILCWVLAKRITGPIEDISEAARRLGSGDFTARAPVDGCVELADFATTFNNMASALCGITEPVIYTVALTNFKRFICAFVGGGVAGVIGGILGIKFYTWGGDGIFRIPSMINPAGLDISFWGFLICAAIAFVVSAIGSYAVTSADEKA